LTHTIVRRQYKPIKFSNKLLKHITPLWETYIHKWNNLLAIKNTSPTIFNYHIQPTDATLAKLPHGDRISLKIQLRTTIDIFQSTLLLFAGTEYRKLPKDLTPKLTLIHPSWHARIRQTELP
jgi:hypothetical protein